MRPPRVRRAHQAVLRPLRVAQVAFLDATFLQADLDDDGVLSPEELTILFAAAPGSPFNELGWPRGSDGTLQGSPTVSQDSPDVCLLFPLRCWQRLTRRKHKCRAWIAQLSFTAGAYSRYCVHEPHWSSYCTLGTRPVRLLHGADAPVFNTPCNLSRARRAGFLSTRHWRFVSTGGASRRARARR